MNEEEQKADQKLVDAYNAGYLIQQYEPELLQKVIAGENKRSEFVNAMDAGKRQYNLDKGREQQRKKDKIVAEQQRQAEKRLQQQKKPKR